MRRYYGACVRPSAKGDRDKRRIGVKWDEGGTRHERTRTVAVTGKTNAQRDRDAQRQADEWCDELNAAEAEGERNAVMRADRTIARYVEDYVDFRATDGTIDPSTVDDYRKSLKDVRDPDGGIADIPLTELLPDDIRAWEAWLLDPEQRGLSPVTVRKRHALLKMALKRAVSDRTIPYSPMEGIKGPKVRRKPPNALSLESFQRFGNMLVNASPTPFIVACALAFWGGMRREEVVALRWGDVDLVRGSIHVHVAHGLVKGTVYEKDTKTHVDRFVPVFPELGAMLGARHDEIEGALDSLGLDVSAMYRIYVCGDVDGRPYSIHMATKAFRVLADSMGFTGTRDEDVTFYDLRHSFATYAMSSHDGEPGLDAVTVAAIMGNSPEVVERWYAAAVPERVMAAGSVLSRKLLPREPDGDVEDAEPVYESPDDAE